MFDGSFWASLFFDSRVCQVRSLTEKMVSTEAFSKLQQEQKLNTKSIRLMVERRIRQLVMML